MNQPVVDPHQSKICDNLHLHSFASFLLDNSARLTRAPHPAYPILNLALDLRGQDLTRARLVLVEATKMTLAYVLDLMGMSAPEAM